MREFHKLYFEKDPIPPELKKDLQELDFISADKETCCRYLLLLAKTCQVQILWKFAWEIMFCCQVIRALTGRRWREVIGQGFIFMWPAAFDLWLKDKKDSKWWVAGGSSRFYRYCFFYNSFAAFPPPQTNKQKRRLLYIIIGQGVLAKIFQEEFWCFPAYWHLREGGKATGEFWFFFKLIN